MYRLCASAGHQPFEVDVRPPTKVRANFVTGHRFTCEPFTRRALGDLVVLGQLCLAPVLGIAQLSHYIYKTLDEFHFLFGHAGTLAIRPIHSVFDRQ